MIKKGVVFINNENFDKDLNLIHFYQVPNEKIDLIKNLDYEPLINQHLNDSITLMSFDNFFIDENPELKLQRHVTKSEQTDSLVKEIYKKNWNKHNLGPIIIPQNKYFVLGDCRDNSEDSRYVGFIDKNKVTGTFIKKKNE